MEGRQPFEHVEEEHVIMVRLSRGEKPSSADDLLLSPPTLHMLLEHCWEYMASDRPTMKQCLDWLTDLQEKEQETVSPSSPTMSMISFSLTPPARSTSLFTSTPRMLPSSSLEVPDDTAAMRDESSPERMSQDDEHYIPRQYLYSGTSICIDSRTNSCTSILLGKCEARSTSPARLLKRREDVLGRLLASTSTVHQTPLFTLTPRHNQEHASHIPKRRRHPPDLTRLALARGDPYPTTARLRDSTRRLQEHLRSFQHEYGIRRVRGLDRIRAKVGGQMVQAEPGEVGRCEASSFVAWRLSLRPYCLRRVESREAGIDIRAVRRRRPRYEPYHFRIVS